MNLSLDKIKLAYNKLKTYVYYDNTELFLREKLVEFETDTVKSNFNLNWEVSKLYTADKTIDIFDIFTQNEKSIEENLESKFTKLLNELNDFNPNSEYFKQLFNSINVNYFPKKIHDSKQDENFVTNKKQSNLYELEKITAFINIPIELHIISIIWINEFGFKFDTELLKECKGNRLILNKEKTDVIKNSSLFKPYFTQYQKWRDESIIVAQNLLNNEKNALFINLDIKDYFHSCRVSLDRYFNIDNENFNCINYILRKIHVIYSNLIAKKHKFPYDFSPELESKSLIPIGLLSSYVIANHYLNDFDKIITNKFKPAYYGRYVDDILIVLSEPNIEDYPNGIYEKYSFDFDEYKTKVLAEINWDTNQTVFELSRVDKYLLQTLYPLFKIIPGQDGKNIVKIDQYDNLVCQSQKTSMYYFDYKESDLVIDKLKQELDFKSSEFKDLPDDNEDLGDFDKNAYYLNYTDSDGKVRTLKDYKENRYGLTVYLTNKILGAIKHKKSVSDDEIKKFLKLFNGQNIIEFYRLWEKIFTYLLVNNKPAEYVDFYFRCIEEIKKINLHKDYFKGTNVKNHHIMDTLIKFLDISHELVLSLNPNFLKQNKKVLKNFEYRSNKLESDYINYFFNEITRPDSFWSMRYRKTNMMRHHYVSIPLLNYTKESYTTRINLLSLNFNVENYTIDNNLISNSPRPIKFWECTISQLFTDLKEKSNGK
ncbi:RNA-directed DNA polymerase [Chryseobacterium jejuense]|uniref:Reverse transcriptase (RNA-dependent DNA polymerase) n=1 Tax=Chryseobacterium jejuense TaxID=445960 RepID=A0A2X2VW72_CHRJE|nr:RNA-directed DNA polymerase [Chryseobacterium jejuense]SDJ11178.1 Reverse transcriptase (RNA-dependent DNA polymerase) [Chryseobacterium jejuense]SQB27915.1 Reverse transcriptase (RNA-dependent DNA polymerase) [Chryseobacterium jejuense]